MGYKLISGWTKHLLQQTDRFPLYPTLTVLLLVTQLGASLHPPLYSDRHYTVVFYLDIDKLWRRILSLDLCAKVSQFYNGGGNLFNYPHFIYLFTST